jgi:acyl carrier protein
LGNQIEPKIRAYIAKNFLFGDSFPYTDQDSLLEKGIIDSTGVLELVGHIQETFNIKVEDDELIPENLDSVRAIVSYIARKSNQAGQ